MAPSKVYNHYITGTVPAFQAGFSPTRVFTEAVDVQTLMA